jgi:hypothetical protein
VGAQKKAKTAFKPSKTLFFAFQMFHNGVSQEH